MVRDGDTKQWIASYKNNPYHDNVHITVTPFGVCIRDEPSAKQKNKSPPFKVLEMLKRAKQRRWKASPLDTKEVIGVWKEYVDILWTTKDRKIMGNVLDVMGQFFLFGSYLEIFDYNVAWKYFVHSADLGEGNAMHHMAYMIEQRLLPHDLYHWTPRQLYHSAMRNYWCAAQSHSENAQLLLGFRYLNGIGMNRSCRHSVFFYAKLARTGTVCGWR